METNRKTLLITGASSDVGIALIRRIHDNYDTVYAHYNNTISGLLTLKQEIGEKLVLIQADFLDIQFTAAFSEKFSEEEVVPTHFVHIPSRPLRNVKFAKTDWETFEDEFSASYRSAVMLCQKILPAMAKRKNGKVIFMLSHNIMNQPPIKYAVPYTSVKYALLGLMKSLSAEYAGKCITVNGVSPSMIETRFLDNVPELIIQKNAAESPLGRNLTVDDVIPVFEFLLSDGADCITGQNIGVTAGN